MKINKYLLGFALIILTFSFSSRVQAVDETTIEGIVTNEFIGGGVAQGWHGDDTAWDYTLPFAFNFYGTDYTDIKIGANGHICFDDTYYCGNWRVTLTDHAGVPGVYAMLEDLRTDIGANDIFITENADNVVIRWNAVEYGYNTDEINFEVVLYENGNIKFNYGAQDVPLRGDAIVGIVKGDNVTYTASAHNSKNDFNQIETSTWGFIPIVNYLNPSDNSNGAELTTNPQITLDRDLYKGTGSITIKKTSDDSIVETFDVASDKLTGWGTDTLSVNPTNNLENLTGYYITIDATAIKDAYDNPYEGISDNSTWNFTTRGINEAIEELSSDECYRLGTAEDKQPEDTTIYYSNNNQKTWDYEPKDNGDGADCSVTHIKTAYNNFLNTISEDLESEFSGTLTDAVVSSNGNGEIIPEYYSPGSYVLTGLDDENISRVKIDSAGNIVIMGAFSGENVNFDLTSGVDLHSSSGSYSGFLTKLNADGSYAYTVILPVGGSDFTIDTGGNILVTGSFLGTDIDFDLTAGVDLHSSNGNSDIFLTKINSDGSYGYTYTMGGSSSDRANGISLDLNDNIFLAGQFSGIDADLDPTAGVELHSSNGNTDIFLTKINTNGTFGYTYTMGGATSSWEFAQGVTADDNGDIFITGAFAGTDIDMNPTAGTDLHTSNGGNDIFLMKINASGSYEYTLTTGGAGNDDCRVVEKDINNNIFLGCSFWGTDTDLDPTAGIDPHTSTGKTDVALIKINADGSYGYAYTWGGGPTDYDSSSSLVTDSLGNVFLNMYFYMDGFDFDPTAGSDPHDNNGLIDAALIKINADGSYGYAYTIGGTSYDTYLGGTIDNDNNIIVGGYFNGLDVDLDPTAGIDLHSAVGQDSHITKINADGTYGTFASFYEKTSSYEVQVQPANTPTAWDKLNVVQTTPSGTSIGYEILDADCEDVLISKSTSTEIDLSSIDSSNEQICLKATFMTTNDQIAASLDKWEISYYSKTQNLETDFKYKTQDHPEIKIKSIKEGCDFVDIEISTGKQQPKSKLDFKVKVENRDKDTKETIKIKDIKTNSKGRATLKVDSLEENTKYKFKVKYKLGDDYIDYSKSKKAETSTCKEKIVNTQIVNTPTSTPQLTQPEIINNEPTEVVETKKEEKPKQETPQSTFNPITPQAEGGNDWKWWNPLTWF